MVARDIAFADRLGAPTPGRVAFPEMETFASCTVTLTAGSIECRFQRREGGADMSHEELIARLHKLLERADDETLEMILLFVERYLSSRS